MCEVPNRKKNDEVRDGSTVFKIECVEVPDAYMNNLASIKQCVLLCVEVPDKKLVPSASTGVVCNLCLRPIQVFSQGNQTTRYSDPI